MVSMARRGSRTNTAEGVTMSLASPTYILFQILLAVLIVVILCGQHGAATIIAKSTVNECINFGEPELLNKKGDLCGKKLVIALTVSGNEVNFGLNIFLMSVQLIAMVY